MSSHMPPVPPANRSNKGAASSRKPGKRNNAQGAENRTVKQTEQRHNAAEEGETANIKQNTTNKGFFEDAERVDCVFDNRAQESATAAAAISGKITGQDPCRLALALPATSWKRPNRQPALARSITEQIRCPSTRHQEKVSSNRTRTGSDVPDTVQSVSPLKPGGIWLAPVSVGLRATRLC